jgi:hypothetical protein
MAFSNFNDRNVVGADSSTPPTSDPARSVDRVALSPPESASDDYKKIKCSCPACSNALSEPSAFRDFVAEWDGVTEQEELAKSLAGAKLRDRALYPITAEDIADIADRWQRARSLVDWPVNVGCCKIVALIQEIADVDFYGQLAMARLNPPEPTAKLPRRRRRPRPAYVFPFGRPSLFLDFDVPLEPAPLEVDLKKGIGSGPQDSVGFQELDPTSKPPADSDR